MPGWPLLIALLAALGAAGVAIVLYVRRSAEVARLQATLEAERRNWSEKLAEQAAARERLTETFRSLSLDALQANSRQFLQLAQTHLAQYQSAARADLETRQGSIGQTIAPLKEALATVTVELRELEKARGEAYGGLHAELVTLRQIHQNLHLATGNLVKALRQPNVRGRWGEMQLRRVVELAGMLEHCDFVEQASLGRDDARVRPDLIVRLPAGRSIVVDAKAPLSAYLDALEASDDETRNARLLDHARQVREKIVSLAKKNYQDYVQPAPELVVLFIPGETFFTAALEKDASLIEDGALLNVVVATPTTLIALLRAIAYGWRQEQIAESAQRISDLGRELYARLGTLGEHWEGLRRSLAGAVEGYNRATRSLESRVFVTARRLRDLDASAAAETIPELTVIDDRAQALQAAAPPGGPAGGADS